MPGSQTLPDCLRVITSVAQHEIRTMAWTPSFPLQRWDGVNERKCLPRVVTIGSSELNR